MDWNMAVTTTTKWGVMSMF